MLVPAVHVAAARDLARRLGDRVDAVLVALVPHALGPAPSVPGPETPVAVTRADLDLLARILDLVLTRQPARNGLRWIGRPCAVRAALDRLRDGGHGGGSGRRLVLEQHAGTGVEQPRDLVLDALGAALAESDDPDGLGIVDARAELGAPRSHLAGLVERFDTVIAFQGEPPLILDVDAAADGPVVDLDRAGLDALLVLARAHRAAPPLVRALRGVADRAVRPGPHGTDAVPLDAPDRRAALALVADHVAVLGAGADVRAAWAPVAAALSAPR